jgi:hypothetical protein
MNVPGSMMSSTVLRIAAAALSSSLTLALSALRNIIDVHRIRNTSKRPLINNT